MGRITSKQVISMMDAVAQVYEQPEVEQLDEIVRNLRPGETIKQYDERKRKEAEAAAQNRDKIVPNRGAYDELTKAQQNSRTQRENEKKLEDLRRQRRSDDEEGLKPTTANLPSDLKDTEQTATAAGQKVTGRVSRGLPADYKETELQAGRDAEKSRTGAGLPQSGGGNQGNYGKGSTTTTPKPQPTDQQKVRAEYDRLRNSKDPKERAQSVTYGRQMAAAGAAKKDFSGYQSAADAKKNLPAPAQRTSIAQRLQAIRDMRAASQSRIAAQGGTPATPAAKPKPKVAPPAPSTTSTSTTPTTTNKLNNGDPMERMTGKGAQSLKETYNSVYEERTEEKVIDEGMSGALKKVIKIGAAAAGAAAGGKALEKATSSKEPTRDQKDAADAKKHLDHYGKTGKMMRNEEKTAADPGMKARMGKEEPKKGGYQLPKRTPANAKNVEYYKDDVDLFDIIKGHFIEEGLTEEEALAKMLDLTDEERTEIIEGSCGSKKKKKSKKGGY